MRTGTAVSLAEAATFTGKNKVTIFRAMKDGKITGVRDENGQWFIELGELERVFPLVASGTSATMRKGHDATSRNGRNDATNPLKSEALRNDTGSNDTTLRDWEALRNELATARAATAKEQDERERERRQLEETIGDLRRRLDIESEERRKTTTQLTALLTDERPKEPEAPKGWLRRLVGT